jgi:DNA helicase II / ATP-dependent DNA helicase PcrA
MSRRLNSPDTAADIDIKACITALPPQPFVVRAGAGSGKTTSLIKAIEWVISTHGASMRVRKQKVACITYTELAASEILADVDRNSLVHVSTIHSFYWAIVKSFQADIKVWLQSTLKKKIEMLADKAINFGPRVKAETRETNKSDQDRYAKHLDALNKVKTFSYSVGSDYSRGVLGHEDVLQLADFLLQNRPLFRKLVALNYPFVFIDESQDTFESVVTSFKLIEAQMRGKFCLGFFGDPMQEIFMRGSGDIPLEEHWRPITKPENFRCAKQILDVANSIRAQGDGIQQVRGLQVEVDGKPQLVQGFARMFILPKTLNRTDALAKVRTWCANADEDKKWAAPELATKVLVIVHRMAAKRLGFEGIYAALSEKVPESLKIGMQDGTGWSLRPFLTFALPIVTAIRAGNEFEAMTLLKRHCPRLAPGSLLKVGVSDVLKEVRKAVITLTEILDDPAASVCDVAIHLRDTGLWAFEDRFKRVLQVANDSSAHAAEAPALDSTDLAIIKMLACPAQELIPYERYILDGSPYATQHGVKGAQFDRVLVVLDEEESNYNSYNYERVFADEQSRNADRAAFETEGDNTWSRTLRLLYVCCTRAKKGLVLAFFVTDPNTMKANVIASGIFSADAILTENALHGT